MKNKKWLWAVIPVAVVVLIFVGIWAFSANTAQKPSYLIEGREDARMSFDAERGTFRDFEVAEDNVYFYCDIVLKNDGAADVRFKLSAISEEDQKSGLLKEAEMKALDPQTGQEQIFEIGSGEQRIFSVTFCAEKGALEPPGKVDRMLPGTIIMSIL